MKKTKNNIKFLIFLAIASLIFATVEENHDCCGDGCLICLFSSITYLLTYFLLIFTITPIVFEKLSILCSNAISHYRLYEIKFSQSNLAPNHKIITTVSDLVTEGEKIQ